MTTTRGVFRGSSAKSEVSAYATWGGFTVNHALDFIGRGSSWGTIDNPGYLCTAWSGSTWKMVISTAMLPNTNTTLALGASGAYDSHWTKFAQKLVAGGQGDAIIRLGWEFNGKYYPWAAGGKETYFVTYWRKIVTKMNAVSGANFTYDWCPLAGNGGAKVEACYPGSSYVDYIGLDAYDTCNKTTLTGANRWSNQRTRVYGLDWHKSFAATKGKLMSFPEWGLTVRPNDRLGGDDNPYYITQMLAWITTNISYNCYFEVDASDAAHRLMLGRFPNSRTTFLAGT